MHFSYVQQLAAAGEFVWLTVVKRKLCFLVLNTVMCTSMKMHPIISWKPNVSGLG